MMKVAVFVFVCFALACVEARGGRGGWGGSSEEGYGDRHKGSKTICQVSVNGNVVSREDCPFDDNNNGNLYDCVSGTRYRNGTVVSYCKPLSCSTDEDCRSSLDPNATCPMRWRDTTGYCSYSRNIRLYESACEVQQGGNVVSTSDCKSCGDFSRLCGSLTGAIATQVTIGGVTYNLYFCERPSTNTGVSSPDP